MKNLYFRILTRPCFIHIGKTLTSNPGLLKFCTHHANDFANTANPVFIPVSIFQQTMVKELRGAGGQMWKGTILSLTRTHTDIAPPNPYAFWPITLLQKIHSRCWRSSSAKKNTRPLRTVLRGNYVSNIYAWKMCVWHYYHVFLLLSRESATPEGQADGQMEWPFPHWLEGELTL